MEYASRTFMCFVVFVFSYSYAQPPQRSPPTQIPEVETGDGPAPLSPLLPPYQECGREYDNGKIPPNGDPQLSDLPWMALMEYQTVSGERKFSCDGTIISKRYILTAAHCVTGDILTNVGKLVSVRVGEYDRSTEVDCVVSQGCNNGSTLDVGVQKVIAHSEFNLRSISMPNDIALVRLEKDLVFNEFVRPICLPNKGMEPAPFKPVFVADWGLTDRNFTGSRKRNIRVPIADSEDCQSKYQKVDRHFALDEQHQFCAGGEAEEYCLDPGSAAMELDVDNGKFLYFGIGIASFGPKPCGIEGLPVVYTKVSSYINWILTTITL